MHEFSELRSSDGRVCSNKMKKREFTCNNIIDSYVSHCRLFLPPNALVQHTELHFDFDFIFFHLRFSVVYSIVHYLFRNWRILSTEVMQSEPVGIVVCDAQVECLECGRLHNSHQSNRIVFDRYQNTMLGSMEWRLCAAALLSTQLCIFNRNNIRFFINMAHQRSCARVNGFRLLRAERNGVMEIEHHSKWRRSACSQNIYCIYRISFHVFVKSRSASEISV